MTSELLGSASLAEEADVEDCSIESERPYGWTKA